MNSCLAKTVCFLATWVATSSALAAGPLVLEGPSGNTPVTYVNPYIVLDIETGPLGSLRNDIAADLVTDAVTLWNNTTTSTIYFDTSGTGVTEDINSSNWTDYLPGPDPDAPIDYNDEDGINPVVFDSDGSIIDAFFYDNASDDIVGFASSTFLRYTSQFTEGFAVINGTIPLLRDDLVLIIAHELGHFIGLDHTQANINNNDYGCMTATGSEYPLMYPFACRDELTLHPDDEISVSMLYPVTDFNQTQGQLIGKFLLPDDTPIRGANIWVEDENGNVYSIVSDYLKQNTGLFNLLLPPGNYTLHANSINLIFNQGSSIGPYADDQYGLSFQYPAASIGDVTLINENGTPVVLNLTAGNAIDIAFYSDGTGTFMSDKVITDPTLVAPTTSAGGGGTLNPFLALLIPALVLSRRRL